MVTTLTDGRSAITQQVARLRALGCKVHTIIGHSPSTGRYIYGIRPPAGVHPVLLDRRLTVTHPAVDSRISDAVIEPHPVDITIAVVRASSGYPNGTWSTESRRDATLNVAEALAHVAYRVEQVDRTSSASTQHYIDTGYYLTNESIPGSCLSKKPLTLIEKVETLRSMALDDSVTPEDIVQYVREVF